MYHGSTEKTLRFYRIVIPRIYEIRSVVSPSEYNKGREVGPGALLRTGRPLFLSVEAGREVNAPMTDLQNLIALSLLPSWTWLHAAEHLRSGASAEQALESLITAHWRDQSDKIARLRSRALAAMGRAAERGIHIVPWSDPRYPAALGTIVDPPLVLWVRGHADALNGPAVGIVGSRAGSPYALAVAERLATDLASRGVVVISGLARG